MCFNGNFGDYLFSQAYYRLRYIFVRCKLCVNLVDFVFVFGSENLFKLSDKWLLGIFLLDFDIKKKGGNICFRRVFLAATVLVGHQQQL